VKTRIFNSHPFYDINRQENLTAELPRKKGVIYRFLRHPLLRPYHRLALFVFAINTAVFYQLSQNISLLEHNISGPTLLSFTLANFGVGIFIRQQQVINLLFKVATSAPKGWPLSVRWALGKVYHFGGVHVGGYFSGTLWFGVFIATAIFKPFESFVVPNSVKTVGLFHLALLSSIMYVALPKFREAHHNTFEKVARFGNWTSLLLFWYQAFHLVAANQQGSNLFVEIVRAPELWVLTSLTLFVALPWLRLRKVSLNSISPSGHVAISKFDYGVTPFAGSSTDLSLNPLLEWHSFANIPSPKKTGFRLCISRAGDWTGEYIDKRPKHIWVKGVPVAGVGNIELLFKRVVWVATGSGVGPCIPHLLDQKVPSQLIWSTKSPRETYGDHLVNEILEAQPNTKIWDTSKLGRPNLVELALKVLLEFDAEAVIVISNKKLTFHLNYELESRGIPCFGAIWDS